MSPDSGLLVLADGMGGYNAGEVASALAIEQARTVLAQPSSEHCPAGEVTLVQRAFLEANAAILAAAARRPECLGMGTTMVLARVRDQHVTIGHIGDSRIYLLRNGHLARLTHDHSVGQAMIDAGVLDEQAARASTLRGVLTRALGIEAAIDADVSQFAWQSGDRFLLCSDGLTDLVTDATLRDVLGQGLGAHDTAAQLLERALAAGGHDNISVLLAFCEQSETR